MVTQIQNVEISTEPVEIKCFCSIIANGSRQQKGLKSFQGNERREKKLFWPGPNSTGHAFFITHNFADGEHFGEKLKVSLKQTNAKHFFTTNCALFRPAGIYKTARV